MFDFLALFFLPLLTLLSIKGIILFQRFSQKKKSRALTVGFFHPYCNAGGGGERVLWCAVKTLQNQYENIHCVVYTGDDVSGEAILEKAERTFNIRLSKPVDFVHLKLRPLVEAKYYPFFTLLLQSLGSVLLGLEAALKHVPDVYIDTMGYAFTLPIFKYLCSAYVGAYVHYPTISTDMLSAVSEKRVTVNNRDFITKNRYLSWIKIFYYKLFSYLYGMVGRTADVVMVNSSWTRNHIIDLWQMEKLTFTVFPPCDISQFEHLSLDKSGLNKDCLRILSIAQFRPEKNHKLQIDAFHRFLNQSGLEKQSATLVLIGSCRHAEDYSRVERLMSMCNSLGISCHVEFKINLSFKEVLNEMHDADISLHTMLNEHFGIGIVESMSAGLIMIANNSGGPRLDIIDHQKTGFLASDVESYAEAMAHVLHMDSSKLLKMRKAAQESVSRFSTKNFEEAFLQATSLLFKV